MGTSCAKRGSVRIAVSWKGRWLLHHTMTSPNPHIRPVFSLSSLSVFCCLLGVYFIDTLAISTAQARVPLDPRFSSYPCFLPPIRLQFSLYTNRSFLFVAIRLVDIKLYSSTDRSTVPWIRATHAPLWTFAEPGYSRHGGGEKE